MSLLNSPAYSMTGSESIEVVASLAIDFIGRNICKEGVEKVLRDRQSELFDENYEPLKNLIKESKSTALYHFAIIQPCPNTFRFSSEPRRKNVMCEYCE